jgi:hypothetical protein
MMFKSEAIMSRKWGDWIKMLCLPFVWLGETLQEDKMALDLFQEIEKAAKAPWRTFSLQIIIDQLGQPGVSDSVCYVLSKSWFRRAWVQQEFALSSRALFACGSLLFSSATVKDVINAVQLAAGKMDARLWNSMLRAKAVVNRELLRSNGSRKTIASYYI